MNKKLLFAAMSLATLTACTNDDFDSQNAAENVSPIKIEILNEGATRASMDGNALVWNANDNDLFTLYHGSAVEGFLSGYQNATYKANEGANGGDATLTSPSMILPGQAIMVWPADTTFRIKSDDALTIKIPANQTNIENNFPYMSDRFIIGAYAQLEEGAVPGYNTAGKDRKYKVRMRPMASQLNLKADYANTDATLATLYTGDDAITKIGVTSIELQTGEGTEFTTEIPVKFTAKENIEGLAAKWNGVQNQTWSAVTDFDIDNIDEDGQVTTLKTTCLTKDADGLATGCKFLILPQAEVDDEGDDAGFVDAAIVVNTNYGKVVVATNANGGAYTDVEIANAWYRFLKPTTDAEEYETKAGSAETSGENVGKHKTTTNIAMGMTQTINNFSTATVTSNSSVIKGEPVGAAATRYVKVLLSHLDMSGLHVKNDKQLRDVVRVWKKMELPSVTVYLDGDEDGVFTMSQQTITTINQLNTQAGVNKNFTVMPCQEEGEECEEIVITGGNAIQDIAFIVPNEEGDEPVTVPVILAANTTWSWNVVEEAATVKVGTGVSEIINKGTLVNAADATLKLVVNADEDAIELINDGTWNITAGTVFVKFDVTNNRTVNISNGAEYRESGNGHVFTNEAETLEGKFLANENLAKVGKVVNEGVFATTANGAIYNYGLIEHHHVDAKTYITKNQTDGATFANTFSDGSEVDVNKMGRINLPYSNKDEDNISINAALNQGFVSVTVENAGETLNAAVVGNKVNYIIVKSGVQKIAAVSEQVEYLEINQPNTEVAWDLTDNPATLNVNESEATYTGLIVLSNVNIKLGTTIHVTGSTFLKATMYVGGVFDNGGDDPELPSWSGYFGNTTANAATKYVTYN